jgi:hypothetical protein
MEYADGILMFTGITSLILLLLIVAHYDKGL